MATFALNITTDDVLELQGIINKLAGELPTVQAAPEQVTALVLPADGQPLIQTDGRAERAEAAPAPTPAVANDAVPERDAHGIKRDLRIHSDAAEPLKADGTWKRRRGLSDIEYDIVYAELVAEAKVGGVYDGPDTSPVTLAAAPAPTPAASANDAAPAPTQQQAAAPATAATGMSAEQAPTLQKAIVSLVQAAGPTAAKLVLSAMGLANGNDATVDQLRHMVAIADMVVAAQIPAAEKATRGPKALADAALTLGYIVDLEA